MTPEEFIAARWRTLLFKHPVPCSLNISVLLESEFGPRHWAAARRYIESRPKLSVSEHSIAYDRYCLCYSQTIRYLRIEKNET